MTVFFKNIKSEKGELILINNLGQIIKKEKIIIAENDAVINYDLKNISTGQYFLMWQSAYEKYVKKITLK